MARDPDGTCSDCGKGTFAFRADGTVFLLTSALRCEVCACARQRPNEEREARWPLKLRLAVHARRNAPPAGLKPRLCEALEAVRLRPQTVGTLMARVGVSYATAAEMLRELGHKGLARRYTSTRQDGRKHPSVWEAVA